MPGLDLPRHGDAAAVPPGVLGDGLGVADDVHHERLAAGLAQEEGVGGVAAPGELLVVQPGALGVGPGAYWMRVIETSPALSRLRQQPMVPSAEACADHSTVTLSLLFEVNVN